MAKRKAVLDNLPLKGKQKRQAVTDLTPEEHQKVLTSEKRNPNLKIHFLGMPKDNESFEWIKAQLRDVDF